MSRELRRQRLEALRQGYPAALATGGGGAYLETVAAEDPLMLVDLCLGPKAPRGAAAIRAVLQVRGELDRQLPSKALAQRLVALSGLGSPDPVLSWVLEAHPTERWALELVGEHAGDVPALFAPIATAEGFEVFLTSLMALGAHEVVAAWAQTGDPRPAQVAWLQGLRASGVRLGARALAGGDTELVFAELVAAWGPDVDGLVFALLPHLGSAQLARELLELLPSEGGGARRLRLVLPGLAEHPVFD